MKEFIFRRNGMYDMTVTIMAINEDAARYIFETSVINPQYYRLDNRITSSQFNFRILTKEEIENNRCKAYDYLI
jgi:hypothetical protein